MKTNFKLFIPVIVLGFVFSLTGCKSKKELAAKNVSDTKANTEILSDVQKNQLKFNTLSAKTSFELQRAGSKSSLSTSAQLRIIKGKGILISLRPFLGIEVAKMVVSNDSVLIVDRMNKQYLYESIADLKKSKSIDFNYNNLEALLTNRLFYPGKKDVSEADYPKFRIQKSQGSYLVSTKDASDILYNFAIDGNDHIISTLIYGEKRNYTLQCSYDKFIVDQNNSYPTNIRFKIGINEKRMDVVLSYSKLDIDKDIDIDYSIPGSYRKVTLDEVLSILSKKL